MCKSAFILFHQFIFIFYVSSSQASQVKYCSFLFKAKSTVAENSEFMNRLLEVSSDIAAKDFEGQLNLVISMYNLRNEVLNPEMAIGLLEQTPYYSTHPVNLKTFIDKDKGLNSPLLNNVNKFEFFQFLDFLNSWKDLNIPLHLLVEAIHKQDTLQNLTTIEYVKISGRTYWHSATGKWSSSKGLTRKLDIQANPFDLIHFLGIEVAEFLGIRVINKYFVDVTDFLNPNYISKRINALKLNTQLYGEIEIVNGDLSTRDWHNSFVKGVVAIDGTSVLSVHDFTFHLIPILFPKWFWEDIKKISQFKNNYYDFMQNKIRNLPQTNLSLISELAKFNETIFRRGDLDISLGNMSAIAFEPRQNLFYDGLQSINSAYSIMLQPIDKIPNASISDQALGYFNNFNKDFSEASYREPLSFSYSSHFEKGNKIETSILQIRNELREYVSGLP